MIYTTVLGQYLFIFLSFNMVSTFASENKSVVKEYVRSYTDGGSVKTTIYEGEGKCQEMIDSSLPKTLYNMCSKNCSMAKVTGNIQGKTYTEKNPSISGIKTIFYASNTEIVNFSEVSISLDLDCYSGKAIVNYSSLSNSEPVEYNKKIKRTYYNLELDKQNVQIKYDEKKLGIKFLINTPQVFANVAEGKYTRAKLEEKLSEIYSSSKVSKDFIIGFMKGLEINVEANESSLTGAGGWVSSRYYTAQTEKLNRVSFDVAFNGDLQLDGDIIEDGEVVDYELNYDEQFISNRVDAFVKLYNSQAKNSKAIKVNSYSNYTMTDEDFNDVINTTPVKADVGIKKTDLTK